MDRADAYGVSSSQVSMIRCGGVLDLRAQEGGPCGAGTCQLGVCKLTRRVSFSAPRFQ